MERREVLRMIAMLTGGAVIGSEIFLSGCNTNNQASTNNFTQDDIALLDEIAETILPRTKTPGAKDAAVGVFMTVMVNDCYTAADQQVFHEGIEQIDKVSKEKYGGVFMKLTAAQRHDLLVALDSEAKQHEARQSAAEKKEMNSHYFTMMKQLALLGFFTSKPGATEAMRFVAVPGRFDSCVPYKKGDRAWV